MSLEQRGRDFFCLFLSYANVDQSTLLGTDPGRAEDEELWRPAVVVQGQRETERIRPCTPAVFKSPPSPLFNEI